MHAQFLHLIRPTSNRLLTAAAAAAATTTTQQQQRLLSYTTQTPICSFPMKPGTVIEGLNFRKDRDPPVVQDEYPDWVRDLASPMITLAKLRRMPIEEATDKDKKRYLKLTRRALIKEKNEELAKK